MVVKHTKKNKTEPAIACQMDNKQRESLTVKLSLYYFSDDVNELLFLG